MKLGFAVLFGDENLLFVREAVFEDFEGIADFNVRMAEETEGKVLDRSVVREGVKAVLADKLRGFYLLAEDGKSGRVVGQLMVTFEWSDWRNKVFWWIQSVYVDRKYRKRRVFSRLFEAVCGMALSQKNVAGLRLYVEKDNDSAKQVYESLGMKESYELYEKTL
jgi:GNAT superfamily N-acetyltransferase